VIDRRQLCSNAKPIVFQRQGAPGQAFEQVMLKDIRGGFKRCGFVAP